MSKYKKSLLAIIAVILIFRVALPVFRYWGDIPLTDVEQRIIVLISYFCDFIVMGYLYYFVRYVKKQKLWLWPGIVWALAGLYGLAIPFVMDVINIDTSNFTLLQMQVMMFLVTGLEGVVRFIPEVIIAVILIRNQAEEIIKGAIKLVGVLMLARLALLFILGVTATYLADLRDIAAQAMFVLFVARFLGMIYMYWVEFISVEKQETTVDGLSN